MEFVSKWTYVTLPCNPLRPFRGTNAKSVYTLSERECKCEPTSETQKWISTSRNTQQNQTNEDKDHIGMRGANPIGFWIEKTQNVRAQKSHWMLFTNQSIPYCRSETSYKFKGKISSLLQWHLLGRRTLYTAIMLHCEWNGISMKSQGKWDWNLGYLKKKKRRKRIEIRIPQLQ